MEKISNNQSTPLWDRPGSERGHLSSVDKAVQAHRDRVDARQMRTQNRLDASKEIHSQFFVSRENMAPMAAQTETLAGVTDLVEEPMVGTGTPGGDEIMALPMAMDDLYLELSASPVRSHAVRIVEADSLEGNLEGQSDEVPKGTYVDYNA